MNFWGYVHYFGQFCSQLIFLLIKNGILAPISKFFTSSEYTVEDSFAVAEEIVEHDSEFLMGSLDIYSLLLTSYLKKLLIFPLMNLMKILKE